jgi:deoxyribodipyrimidine photo-lyase
MTTGILWFRGDLRLADNPALTEALSRCERVVPVFIHAPVEAGNWAPGAASRWWLHHSLVSLKKSLRQRGSRLILRPGPSLDALGKLIRETGATHVFRNHVYEPRLIRRDEAIKARLESDGVTVHDFNAALLNEPWSIAKPNGSAYRVFTAYWRACEKAGLNRAPAPAPEALPPVPGKLKGVPVAELGLLPSVAWDSGLKASWQVGETAARATLGDFIDQALAGYATERDRPDREGTSWLSPHLHFGEISPRQVLHTIRQHDTTKGAAAYVRELGWREFAYHLLYHFPRTPERPLDSRFARFSWAKHYQRELAAWREGRTGIPIVDAGMRELWYSGWMHNRVRMVAASFLTKNLLIPWQEGARWFWDTLIDADLANNTFGWQWTAGCGADAAPYFRIFNPVLQGQRYDPGGAYVRRWVPEIAGLPDKYVHQPWAAPGHVLGEAGVELGTHYPRPLVALQMSRRRALMRFEQIKAARR